MDSPNLLALAGLLKWAMADDACPEQVARRLAERDVLAISALTAEQLGDLTCLDERVLESPVDYLRRIARGEPNA